jgi:hypothetical protein
MQEGVVALVERGEVEATDLRQDEVVAGVQVLAMGWVFLLPRMSRHWMEEGEGEEEEEEAGVLPYLFHDLLRVLPH